MRGSSPCARNTFGQYVLFILPDSTPSPGNHKAYVKRRQPTGLIYLIVLQRAAEPVLQRPLQRRPGRTTPPEVVCSCHGHDLQLSFTLACFPKRPCPHVVLGPAGKIILFSIDNENVRMRLTK